MIKLVDYGSDKDDDEPDADTVEDEKTTAERPDNAASNNAALFSKPSSMVIDICAAPDVVPMVNFNSLCLLNS